jgi:hypothetical protein
MQPSHPYWNGTILLSKNVVIESNHVFNCNIGINFLQGINLIARDNDIASNVIPFAVNTASVYDYTVSGNLGYP